MNEYLLDQLPPSVRDVILTGTIRDICDSVVSVGGCYDSPYHAGIYGPNSHKPVFMFPTVVVKLGNDAIREGHWYRKFGKKYDDRIARSCPIPHGIVMERCTVVADIFGSPYYVGEQYPKYVLFSDETKWLRSLFTDITTDGHLHNIAMDSRGNWVLIDIGVMREDAW